MSAIRLQLEAVGLGHLWRDGDLETISAEIARRREFARVDSAGGRALLLADALAWTWRGDFTMAVELFGSVVDEAERRGETRTAMIAHSVLSWIWMVRGESVRAVEESAAAGALVGSGATPEVDAMVRAMRIANSELPEWDEVAPELDGCRRIVEASGRDDVLTNIDLAEGWALAASGRSSEALALLRPATAGIEAPLDRAVNELRIAEVLAVDGCVDEARTIVNNALEVFDSWGARYWYARSAMLLASLEGDRGGRHVRVVLDSLPTDVAYLRLIEPSGDLVIDLDGTPAVRRDGAAVAFLTRHAEATVRLLAASGEDGMGVGELAAILWPTADQAKVRQRFRTMLWQVRSGLGPDAWRLQRRRDTVTLQMTGVDTIGDLDRSALAATFRL